MSDHSYDLARVLRISEADFEERPGGLYWLGPLVEGKQIVLNDRFVFEGLRENGHYVVSLCDDPDGEREAEWGSSADGNAEEAWRYALGAAIGPYDYDEPYIDLPLDRASGDPSPERAS